MQYNVVMTNKNDMINVIYETCWFIEMHVLAYIGHAMSSANMVWTIFLVHDIKVLLTLSRMQTHFDTSAEDNLDKSSINYIQ